ncbi:MAG: pilus assembly protein TadG-related protein [Sphingomicrobium sp.]|nr:pilus assembly protein TadG-related protein [Sphingomonadales bacterium]
MIKLPFTRLAADDRGNALALFALALPMLIGAVGLAVDTAHWVLLKRQLQQVADSAAMSGSFTAIQGGDIDFAVDEDAARRRSEIGPMNLRATLSPKGHDGDPNAVAVTVSAPAALSFASLFLSKPLMVSASATATMVETNDFCAFALDASSDSGISIDPDSTIESECGIATNSSAADAIRGDATSRVAAKKLFAFGGIVGAGSDPATRARAYSPRQKDPGEGLVVPDVPNTGCPNITVNPSEGSGVTLKPGCFGNLVLNGKVTLQPGSYILNRGNVLFGPKADVTCDGCTFFLTSEDAQSAPGSIGHARIDASASVHLSAPSQGDYAGLLMLQDRRAPPEAKGEENVIAGNAQSKFDGVLYFPSQSLKIDGRGSPDFRCARLIGHKLILSGHVMIARGCSADTGKITLAGAEVKLVA